MRKILRSIAELLARRRILAHAGVRISPTAKISYRNLRARARCILQVGNASIVEGHLISERDGAKIIIGDRSFVGNSLVSSAAEVVIGDDVLISWGCSIVDHDSHPVPWTYRMGDVGGWYRGEKNWSHVRIAPVKIGNKCWVGFNAAILKGVEIGEGGIVGAGSIVTKSVAPWTIVAGNPARFIRELTHAER